MKGLSDKERKKRFHSMRMIKRMRTQKEVTGSTCQKNTQNRMQSILRAKVGSWWVKPHPQGLHRWDMGRGIEREMAQDWKREREETKWTEEGAAGDRDCRRGPSPAARTQAPSSRHIPVEQIKRLQTETILSIKLIRQDTFHENTCCAVYAISFKSFQSLFDWNKLIHQILVPIWLMDFCKRVK